MQAIYKWYCRVSEWTPMEGAVANLFGEWERAGKLAISATTV
jgi:hypothetical protein